MRRGALLIEVVLAFALIAVVFLTLIELYPASFLTHARARQRVYASALAESIMDACSALPLDALLPPPKVFQQWDDADPGPLAQDFYQPDPADGCQFLPLVSVQRQDVDPQGRNLLIAVKVTVRWKEQQLDREQWFSNCAR